MEANYTDVVRRIGNIEGVVKELQDDVAKSKENDARMEQKIQNLGTQFESLKADILGMMTQQNERIWGLITIGIKVIIALIVVIVALVGVKLGADIFKIFS